MTHEYGQLPAGQVETLVARDAVLRRMGDWAGSNALDVTIQRGKVVLDLRTLAAAGPVTVDVRATRGVLTLLVNGDTAIDADRLSWRGRGRLRDRQGRGNESGAPVRLSGVVEHGQVRVYRDGVAMWFGLFSREHRDLMRREHERAERGAGR